MIANATLGPVPGWLVVIIMVVGYGFLGFTTMRSSGRGGDEVHV